MAGALLESLTHDYAAAEAALPGTQLAWLRAARREHFTALARDGLPNMRAEAWKYTALRALDARRFERGDARAAARTLDPAILALPGVDGPRMVFVNGAFRADLSRLDALPSGLTLQPLAVALATNAEALRFPLSRAFRDSNEPFAHANAALAGDGVVLSVAPHMDIAATIHLVFVGAPAGNDVVWHARNLLEIGSGGRLRLIEHYLGTAAHANLGNVLTQIRVGDGAMLDLLQLQDEADGATLMRRSDWELGSDARVSATTLELAGQLVRHDLHVGLNGVRAQLASRGVFALRQRQHADTRIAVIHAARDSVCDLVWRGVADQRARGVFHGAITVAQGADGADARLSNRNLLLSAQAEIDTQPVLEIHADEVKASHGATVGQLDEHGLFYLRSRGIAAAQARSMLTYAFCRAMLDAVEPNTLREHLAALLIAHLPGAGTPA